MPTFLERFSDDTDPADPMLCALAFEDMGINAYTALLHYGAEHPLYLHYMEQLREFTQAMRANDYEAARECVRKFRAGVVYLDEIDSNHQE